MRSPMVTARHHYRGIGKFVHVKELHWWAHQDSNLGPTDYEGKSKGRYFNDSLRWRLFFCPGFPPVSRDSMALRRVCVECRAAVEAAGIEPG
jgi:hypothetical protein